MSYITPEELKTHAHEEEISAIIRGDETIALASIDMAVDFVTTKLMKHYDTNAIFSAKGDERSPLIVKIVKDIALWELIGLVNVSIDYNDKKFRYQEAVNWLTAVYKGMPANLPRLENEDPTSSSFKGFSNPKRQNYY